MSRLNCIPLHRAYALIALLCPIIAGGVSWLVLNSHAELWSTVNQDLRDDANRQAGAMMAIGETFQVITVMTVGFVSGLFFSILSLVSRRSKLAFFCLLLNVAPFVVLAIVLIKG